MRTRKPGRWHYHARFPPRGNPDAWTASGATSCSHHVNLAPSPSRGLEKKKPGECRASGCRVWRLVARALAVEAVAAVDGLRAARAERNLRLAAAVRAGRAEHLARCAVIAATTRIAAARIAATAGVAAVASATAGRL